VVILIHDGMVNAIDACSDFTQASLTMLVLWLFWPTLNRFVNT
jgi:hypothetical protein